MDIHIQTGGLQHVQRKLNIQAEKLGDLTKYWDLVGKFLQKKTIQERFEKEQTPDGKKWEPLSSARIKQRLKKHKKGDMKILSDEGYLRRIHYEAGKDYMQIGTNAKYAKVHQFGFKEKNIPARPFLGVNEQELRYIKGMLTSYVKRHIIGGS